MREGKAVSWSHSDRAKGCSDALQFPITHRRRAEFRRTRCRRAGPGAIEGRPLWGFGGEVGEGQTVRCAARLLCRVRAVAVRHTLTYPMKTTFGSLCCMLIASSLYAQVAPAVTPTPAELARYDLNKNGRLDQNELAARQ